ncbi:MAG: hypothetical protein IJG82_09215 [Atopobiaceae bacterium]|nr:hypothetical protein [Atopobiaceae bacterium]
MSRYDMTIEPDMFSASINELFGEIKTAAGESIENAARAGSKDGSKAWRKNIPSSGIKGRGRYLKSIRSTVKGKGEDAQGICYSTMPGLPHLLEKGHAIMGGGRSRAFPHVAPAAETAFESAIKALEKSMGGL